MDSVLWRNSIILTIMLISEKVMLVHLQVLQLKRGNFIAGYQYKASGGFVMDDGFETPNPTRLPCHFWVTLMEKPLNLGNIGSGQPQINELGPQAYVRQVSE